MCGGGSLLKNAVYTTPVDFEMDLVAKKVSASANFQQNPGVFERFRQSMIQRCNACIGSNGGNFDYLL